MLRAVSTKTFSQHLSVQRPLHHASARIHPGSTGMMTRVVALLPSDSSQSQRQTRRVPIMQRWKSGPIRTREQVKKKLAKVTRNQERAETQRVKFHLKKGTLYEYIERKTADEETKQRWFHHMIELHSGPKAKVVEPFRTESPELDAEIVGGPTENS